jgi:hypothetical protein
MSFTENLGLFTDALGVENAPSIFYLSLVPWPDSDTRDQFITALTGHSVEDANG